MNRFVVVTQSLPALEGAHSALNNLFLDQLVKAHGEGQQQEELLQQPKSLMDWPVYRRQYHNIKDNITKKSERSKTVDPQRGTIQDSYTPDDYYEMINAMVEYNTYEGDRMAAMATWGHSMVGRGDDLRLFHIADIIAPLAMPAIGEMPGGTDESRQECFAYHTYQATDLLPACRPAACLQGLPTATSCPWCSGQARPTGPAARPMLEPSATASRSCAPSGHWPTCSCTASTSMLCRSRIPGAPREVKYHATPTPRRLPRPSNTSPLVGCLCCCLRVLAAYSNREEWLSAALFPGKTGGPTENISYDMMAKELKKLCKSQGLTNSKVTHMFRVGGARFLDMYGIDDAVSNAGLAACLS